jgi:predicted enzyme related to lactoylglutathione lyase
MENAMKLILALALMVLLPSLLSAHPSEQPDQAPILAMGIYVPTDDMRRSETFYRTLFDQAPVIALPDFVAFDVAGGWFVIVSRARYAPASQPGMGAVPYLQSGNLEVLQTRICATGTDMPEIIEEPGISLIKVTDPNGQLVEFFMLTGQ